MRLLFMGTPDFAAQALRVIIDAAPVSEIELVGVVTAPDSVNKRGSTSRPTPVAEMASEFAIPVLKPETLTDDATVAAIAAMRPDVIVVVAYGRLLPQTVLDIPRHGCINIHASLLPRWRGAAPIERAILMGDPAVGVSIMRMTTGLDQGPFCAQAAVMIQGQSAGELRPKLARLGAELLLVQLPDIAAGYAPWQAQDPVLANYADKLERGELFLRPDDVAELNERRVRASGPSAPARATLVLADGSTRGFRALEASVYGGTWTAGSVAFDENGILLGCADNSMLLLRRLIPDGKRDMTACDWARGIAENLKAGATWR
ncbi:MAG: methionyl-tRNA formyltransferase [Actinomycetes bacterium]|jgi:methionyl-tRNA formyltransferase|nr:methionyl-tRNA formyltransferase [Actinomycetes bacterium]